MLYGIFYQVGYLKRLFPEIQGHRIVIRINKKRGLRLSYFALCTSTTYSLNHPSVTITS